MESSFNCGCAAGTTHIDKERVIDLIIESCDGLVADDVLKVYDFGRNGDLALYICKDSEYDAEQDKDYSNMVTITTSQRQADGMMVDVDDTEDTYVTDGSLYKELDRIWEYREFGLL